MTDIDLDMKNAAFRINRPVEVRDPFADPEDMTGFDEACAFFETAPVSLGSVSEAAYFEMRNAADSPKARAAALRGFYRRHGRT